MVAPIISLSSLPNEVLDQSLNDLSTRELLPLVVVSRRFYDLILEILRRRLLAATGLDDRKMIFECFHPAAKDQDPYLYCEYLGTPGLDDTTEDQTLSRTKKEKVGELGRLTSLYSRFRPLKSGSERRNFLKTNLSAPFTGRISLTPAAPTLSSGEEGYVSHNISLDTDELFSQLCVVTSLGKVETRKGILSSLVEVSDSLVRVFRDWLEERANSSQLEDAETRTLWLDSRCDAKLRVQRVRTKAWPRPAPVLLHRDEDPAIRYSIEIEEVLIRTTRLLLRLEDAKLKEEDPESSTAMVFALVLGSQDGNIYRPLGRVAPEY